MRTMAHSTTAATMLDWPPPPRDSDSLMEILLLLRRLAGGRFANRPYRWPLYVWLLVVVPEVEVSLSRSPSGSMWKRGSTGRTSRLATKPTISTPTMMYRESVYRSAPVRPAEVW